MNVAIIKYNAGNIQSVEFALQRLGVSCTVTDDKEFIRAADKVIFPGVGEASTTMHYLRESGLDKLIVSLKQPVLGICLGLQLMCRRSEEGDAQCLGIFPVDVKRFPATGKVPHMGWNTLEDTKSNLFDASIEGRHVYFVHSFYAEMSEYTIATTNYLVPFSASLHKDNFYAAQFHPEKSAKVGEQVLRNFVNLK
jgi:imidazole glycerol-phosphate synthase subunit HisH